MELDAIEQLLQASIGLSAASIGSPAIGRAVRERLSACGIEDVDAYLARLRASPSELQALVEAVVVPETWFFRDRQALTALGRLAHDTWLPAHAEGVLTVLSLPCSSGEEPYSIAMALLDAAVPADRFRVDAVDISARGLEQAAGADYGRNSFRGEELGFRDRYFDPTERGYRVREQVRERVHFQQGNLFAPDLLQGVAPYDVICCRNILIYFDRQTQDRALAVLMRLLHDQGVLFVAPAETSVPAAHGLVSTREPLVFAFRRAGGVQPARRRARPILPMPPPPLAARAPAAVPPPVVSVPPRDPAAGLVEAGRLADHGHFDEAAIRCEEYVREFGASAPALSLLGLVREATGNPAEAAAFYRKALYLDPDHYDTQVHLALLMDQQGDPEGAQVLRDRTRRLELKRKAPHA